MRDLRGFCASLVVALVASACTAPARSAAPESGKLLMPPSQCGTLVSSEKPEPLADAPTTSLQLGLDDHEMTGDVV
jgi:hypothetical protein